MVRIDGKPVLEVPDAEAAGLVIEAQLQLTTFQYLPILIAEQRQQHLIVKCRLSRRPIDVEEVGEGRRPAPLQHVEPPTIVRTADPHVIGDEIEHLAHASIA